MLLDIRETVRNSKPIKYTLITLISIPFVLFGIGSYFSGGNAPVVAEVDGEEITQYELDAAAQRQRAQLARMFGGRLPEGFADDAALRAQALEQLVTQRVLEAEVAGQRFAVGDETLARAIRDLPMFQVDGRFDPETYERQVRVSGLTVPAFEQSFRDDTALEQFRTGVVDTSFTLAAEAERLETLARQQRLIDAVRFDLAAASEAVEIEEEAIVAHFEENGDRYVFPERAKIEWIELDADALAEGIDVSEEEARARYESDRASYVQPEQREASHILLELDEDADEETVSEKRAVLEEARERLDAGEDFADLARELSEDIGSAESGGSLGLVGRGAMVPAFEEALFALENEGDVSEPVRSDFGLHLIRLDRIVPESGKPFEEVREEIVERIRTEEAEREFFDRRSELADIVFDESDSLEPAAEAAGLEVKTSDWIDQETAADAGPVLSNPAVLAAMADPEVREEGLNSDLIEIDERRVVALRVLESEGPRPKTLEDVREEIVEELRAERAGERLDALAEEAVERLEKGDSAEAIAEEEPLATAIVDETIGRQTTLFDRAVVDAIFALPRPEDASPRTATATLANGDRLAYALREVIEPPSGSEAVADDGTDGESEGDGTALESPPTVTAGADPALGNTEFEALLGSLRERADVDLDP